MRKIEAYTGSAVWMAVSLLMAAAALEPVDVAAVPAPVQVADAACAEGSGQAADSCASARL